MRTSAVILGITLLATAAGADGAVLCQTRGGQVMVREACKKRQHAVTPDAFGVKGAAGPAGSAGATGRDATFPLRLVDANDTEVGRILHFRASQAVVEIDTPSIPSPLIMFVYRDGFGSDNFPLLYSSNDCSGVAYMRVIVADAPGLRPPYALVWGRAVYHATGPSTDISYGSQEYASSTSCSGAAFPTDRGTCCLAQADDYSNVVPTARIPLGNLGLVPPFRAIPR